MPSKEERNRRKALLQRLAEQNRQNSGEHRPPLSLIDLGDLFDFLDLHLIESGCDHTLGATRGFLKSRGLNEDEIIPWLADSCGFCDCEVLANVEDPWVEDIQRAREQRDNRL